MMKKQLPILFTLSTIALLANLTACGGGSSSGDDNNNTTPTWTQGEFLAESQFKNLCQTPRSGGSFPDKQGTILHENHYLRSWSNNTYLWYDEIPDLNPANYNSPIDYFELLKTSELSPSGNTKDKFHFTYGTEEWEQLSQSGQSAGYGAEWALIATAPPRKILVAFTEPDSPASSSVATLARGAEILFIDGVDVVNANGTNSVNIINAGLFPQTAGETHTFVVRDLNSTDTRSISMTSAIITSQPVRQVSTIATATGDVGYILFNSHIATAESGLIDAVNQLKTAGVNDLVLDLRYNGGGLLAIGSQLSYMIAGTTATQDKIFDNTQFNDKHTTINPVTRRALTPTPFYNQTLGFSTTAGQALPTLDLNRVYILATDDTCSASEAIINGLLGIDVEVILIGSTTCGKPYGFYPQDNCGTTYFTIQFKGENHKGFGDYSDGFSPENTAGTVGSIVAGCSVSDDFTHALGNSDEAQLAAALAYRSTGSCPTPTGKAIKQSAYTNQSIANKQDDGLNIKKPFRLNDKIFGIPNQ
ncbi:S41 family peptidase [Aliikangiella sp. IMCC44359]|uniref:S41 family peptidase n=1 Tax=Aliikangiella sp. IMCC44359 TaxID=3459125 RepID=UPI00403ACEB7